MLPERVPPLFDSEACRWLQRWGISDELGARLIDMEQRFHGSLPGHPLGLSIISGFRTVEHQHELELAGRPTAPADRSTHTTCPATGADLQVTGLTPTLAVKHHFGRAAIEAGLRWGGGSSIDSNGIPSDWNHVDLGPRV